MQGRDRYIQTGLMQNRRERCSRSCRFVRPCVLLQYTVNMIRFEILSAPAGRVVTGVCRRDVCVCHSTQVCHAEVSELRAVRPRLYGISLRESSERRTPSQGPFAFQTFKTTTRTERSYLIGHCSSAFPVFFIFSSRPMLPAAPCHDKTKGTKRTSPNTESWCRVPCDLIVWLRGRAAGGEGVRTAEAP
jgi:hypothetical protein